MKKTLLFLGACIVYLTTFAQSWTSQTGSYLSPDGSWPKKIFRLPIDTTINKTGLAQIGAKLYVGNGTNWGQIGGFDPTVSQTITAPYWHIDNAFYTGINQRSGFYDNDFVTTFGDWNGNGNNTIVYVDDDAESVQVWASSGLEVWRPTGYTEGDDNPRVVTKLGNDGSIWTANGSLQILPDGQLDIAEAIDLYPDGSMTLAHGNFQFGNDGGFTIYNPDYSDGFFQVQPSFKTIYIGDVSYDHNNTYTIINDNSQTQTLNANNGYNFYGGSITSQSPISVNNPDANDGFGAAINITTDQIHSIGTNSNEDTYEFTISQYGLFGYCPADIGTDAGFALNYSYTNGYNNIDNSSYHFGNDGASITNSDGLNFFIADINGIRLSPDGDSYVWISNNGQVLLGNGGFNQTNLLPDYIRGYSSSLDSYTWQINNGNGSISFDNGAITSDGAGNIHANTISLWDTDNGVYSGIYTNNSIWSFHTPMNGDYYGSLDFGSLSDNRTFYFPDKDGCIALTSDFVTIPNVFTDATFAPLGDEMPVKGVGIYSRTGSTCNVYFPNGFTTLNDGDVIEAKFAQSYSNVIWHHGFYSSYNTPSYLPSSVTAGQSFKFYYSESSSTWY